MPCQGGSPLFGQRQKKSRGRESPRPLFEPALGRQPCRRQAGFVYFLRVTSTFVSAPPFTVTSTDLVPSVSCQTSKV